MSPSAQALELENFLPYRLSVLAQLVSDGLHELYAGPFELSVTQWRVLAALGRFAPLTASDVAQHIVMDKVAVSRAVAALLRRGLVERVRDRDDGRRATLTLSPRGRAVHARIVPLALAYQQRLCAAMTDDERAQLDVLTQRLFDRAKQLREPPADSPDRPQAPALSGQGRML